MQLTPEMFPLVDPMVESPRILTTVILPLSSGPPAQQTFSSFEGGLIKAAEEA